MELAVTKPVICRAHCGRPRRGGGPRFATGCRTIITALLSAASIAITHTGRPGADMRTVMQSVGYVNRNATYWDELNLQVKQIMYQLGLEREPQTPRKRAKKTRRRGPRMSGHRSQVEL
ncbi:hypothetical protein Bbelb_108060 [Branchiostoma belcheri]|nr:hypothetical protein Bbelb_108060 [Branchiostoma belcheri]